MTRTSHYTVLGIDRRECVRGVRDAYLRLVKDLHPDHAGVAGAEAFRAVQEAYDVLSDPERRRAYDHELDRRVPVRRYREAAPPVRRPPEPLIPEPASIVGEPPDPMSVGDQLTGLFEALAGPAVPGGFEWPRRPPLDVVVPADLAARGGDVALAVPVREVCPECFGTGIRWPSDCPVCGRAGVVIGRRLIRLTVPPGLRSGTVVRLRPAGAGGQPLTLRLNIDRRLRSPPWW